MAGLELKGQVVRREADSHRTSNFGENWTVLSVDGDTKARDCFAWGNAELHLPRESDVTPVCACEGQYWLVLVKTGKMLPGRLALMALPELPLSFQPHWFLFYTRTLAHGHKSNCGHLLMPQLFVPHHCQALCEVWMTAGGKTVMWGR